MYSKEKIPPISHIRAVRQEKKIPSASILSTRPIFPVISQVTPSRSRYGCAVCSSPAAHAQENATRTASSARLKVTQAFLRLACPSNEVLKKSEISTDRKGNAMGSMISKALIVRTSLPMKR